MNTQIENTKSRFCSLNTFDALASLALYHTETGLRFPYPEYTDLRVAEYLALVYERLIAVSAASGISHENAAQLLDRKVSEVRNKLEISEHKNLAEFNGQLASRLAYGRTCS
ncbi:hypothetical protein [Pseudomonas aeruginosa]|uniref:hypothetical protein n=1 Tax=Pseudomonas aeruginosa TaxID=287 RepID=UPI00071C590A|nr:hypothetical protein [Pseudomonas aeruginosa]KSS39538.1 hypothetical protein APB59_30065 [Pseudomonas aeruginosa]RPY64256.1 hypothetical protein IPC677_07370 [Pseudomonas aeruginosa]